MKNKVKISLVVAGLALGSSGCGFKMIKKADAQAQIDKVYAQVDAAKAQACGPEVDQQLNQIKGIADALVLLIGK